MDQSTRYVSWSEHIVMKKRMMIFPYGRETSPLPRYAECLANHEISCLVVPSPLEMSRKDSYDYDGGTPIELKMSNSFYDALRESDTVFFTDELSNSTEIAEYIEKALSADKEVLITQQLMGKLDISESLKNKLVVLGQMYSTISVDLDLPLRKISIPVIAIMGQGNCCQKFDIQLGLRKAFQSGGYSVAQIGTKNYSELFGFPSWPDSGDQSLTYKTVLYNRFISNYLKSSEFDVLILGVPGGIMPINRYNSERYGETALAITAAAKPDVSIVCCYYLPLNEDYIQHIKSFCQYRFGTLDSYIHVSNTRLIKAGDGKRDLEYMTLDFRHVLRETLGYEGQRFNVFDNDSAVRVYQEIIDELLENIDII